MIDLNDSKWEQLKGGYKVPYNPAPALKRLESNQNVEDVWKEFWNELHHQGDIGDASYAVVPYLVKIKKIGAVFDWNFYALIFTIEFERHRKTNPKIPSWLIEEYKSALNSLFNISTTDLQRATDELTIRAITALLLLLKKQYKLADYVGHADPSEIDEYAKERIAWDELYNTQ